MEIINENLLDLAVDVNMFEIILDEYDGTMH